jgi:hypothetical protein
MTAPENPDFLSQSCKQIHIYNIQDNKRKLKDEDQPAG